ncbi:MAG: hypothetical protein ABSA83_17560 [Verrucomicrobiota bacterium]|jgi:hypothetical protein
MKRLMSITGIVGKLPYRLALAGGWIDQPFVSRHNPDPPGSMVVVNVLPQFRFMDRAGICSSTRQVALRIWKGGLPKDDPARLARKLYQAENHGQKNPSGSQDMIGLVYPGINRLDYDFAVNGGVFPSHIQSLDNARHARWLEKVLHLLPVAQRPDGYRPLGEKNLDAKWIARLGHTGRDCFQAILKMDAAALGVSFNDCMECWESILPCTVRHPALKTDLAGLLRIYQSQYPGAMYSGCGGGYLFVVSQTPVPGAFQIKIRTSSHECQRD